jgi:RNA polymerase sigma-70 factor (ECF subfamily)
MESFETYRPLLFSIAYRMLGSVMEAEDMVQETFLRVQTMQAQNIESPKAFLSTVLTRLCLNRLESAQHRRETYIGPWLPEPVLTSDDAYSSHTGQAILHESISYAFLVLLETLSPLERAVFILHRVFDYEYAEVAEIVDKEEAACRQLFSRAKKHIAARRPRFHPTRAQHRHMLEEFMRAVGAGELDGLMQLLTEDVTMWADGGGKARGAATRPLHGRDAVARFLLASTRLPAETYSAQVQEANGEPAAILRAGKKALVVFFIEPDAGHIRAIRAIANPDKLKHL